MKNASLANIGVGRFFVYIGHALITCNTHKLDSISAISFTYSVGLNSGGLFYLFRYLLVLAVIPCKKEALTIEKNKFTKSVSFNRTNVSDQQILKHVSRRNFSGYVKKLILADMKQRGVVILEATPTKPETASDKMSRMKAELKRKSAESVNEKADRSTDT